MKRKKKQQKIGAIRLKRGVWAIKSGKQFFEVQQNVANKKKEKEKVKEAVVSVHSNWLRKVDWMAEMLFKVQNGENSN